MSVHRIGDTRIALLGVDKQCAEEIVHSVERFHRDFPRAAQTLERVSLWDVPEAYRYAFAATCRAEGEHLELNFPEPGQSYQVKLNSYVYGQGHRGDLLRLLDNDAAKQFHVVHTPEAPLEHELGHVLDLYEGQRIGSYATPAFDRIKYPDSLTVSGYAIQGGPHETFADAFAGWWSESQPVRPTSPNVQRAIDLAARAGGWQGRAAA